MDSIKVYIVRESDGTYSSYMDDKANLPYGLIGEGATVAEAMDEWNRSYNDMRKLFEEEGKEFVEANGYRNPSPKTTAKIQDALHSFGKELSQLQLV